MSELWIEEKFIPENDDGRHDKLRADQPYTGKNHYTK